MITITTWDLENWFQVTCKTCHTVRCNAHIVRFQTFFHLFSILETLWESAKTILFVVFNTMLMVFLLTQSLDKPQKIPEPSCELISTNVQTYMYLQPTWYTMPQSCSPESLCMAILLILNGYRYLWSEVTRVLYFFIWELRITIIESCLVRRVWRKMGKILVY